MVLDCMTDVFFFNLRGKKYTADIGLSTLVQDVFFTFASSLQENTIRPNLLTKKANDCIQQ